MNTFAERVIAFNRALAFTDSLPAGIRIMNPFRDNPGALAASEAFYRKYYSDNRPRRLILGINPGRLGAGATGIPFTDTKRLRAACGIPHDIPETHEPSSVFVYEVIAAMGGPEAFYGRFYINSVCPLGFTKTGAGSREKNYNYYDDSELLGATAPFITENIRRQIALGVLTDTCFCLGTGKNLSYLATLNSRHAFFGKVTGLEHPRFVMQYRAKSKDQFIARFLELLGGNGS